MNQATKKNISENAKQGNMGNKQKNDIYLYNIIIFFCYLSCYLPVTCVTLLLWILLPLLPICYPAKVTKQVTG